MTVFGEVLVGILLSVVCVLIGVIVTNRNKVTIEEFEKHKKDPVPHTDCPVHEKMLELLTKKIDKIDGKIDKVLEKV